MKNGVDGHRYVMITDAAESCIELPGAFNKSCIEEDVQHVGKIGYTAHVKPVPELLDAHLDLPVAHAGFAQRFAQFVPAHADQRRLVRVCGHARGLSGDALSAYAAAGIIDYDGTYVYGLDAETGKLVWQNDSTGHLDPELRKGVSGSFFFYTSMVTNKEN